jgi:hypothetical protein
MVICVERALRAVLGMPKSLANSGSVRGEARQELLLYYIKQIDALPEEKWDQAPVNLERWYNAEATKRNRARLKWRKSKAKGGTWVEPHYEELPRWPVDRLNAWKLRRRERERLQKEMDALIEWGSGNEK